MATRRSRPGLDDLLQPIDPETERPKRLAPRRGSLHGLRLGLLDNRKNNGDHLLRHLAARLDERYGLTEVVELTKPIFSRPAPAAQIERLARCDLVLTALAD